MGDANVRRPVATRFEHGVDFGLLVHKSPFMADDRDPLVLSNYIFELLEVNPGVAGFLIQLHPDDVDAVVESVTAHAEKGAGTKTTLYVGQEEEEVEEVEEEEEDAGGVGAGGRKEKPHNPLMISVQKVRIRPGKGKGQSDGWFPQPLTHNTRRVCTDDPENKLPMHSLCPTREWEREWYGVTTPNIVSGQGVILFPFGATPPLWRVRELYTLTQVERHRALTTKFSKAWGDSGWSPTRWIHWCLAHSTFFAEKWRNIFQFSSIPTEYRHGPYKRRLKNCFKGWSLLRPSMSLRHMHHCMSMNALEQGLLGLEAAKATDIDDFV